MAEIISRNFRVLCDFMDVYQFMIDIYEKIGFKPLVHWTFWEKKILAAAINSTD